MAALRQNRFAALEHEVSADNHCTRLRVAYTRYHTGSACSVWVVTHCECDSCELRRMDDPNGQDAAFEWPDEGYPVHPHPHAKEVQADLKHEKKFLKRARRACLCSPHDAPAVVGVLVEHGTEARHETAGDGTRAQHKSRHDILQAHSFQASKPQPQP